MNKTWTPEQLARWKEFWESEMGEFALSKMKELENSWLDATISAQGSEQCTYCAGRAAGIRICIEDIKQGITLAEQTNKGEKKSK